jgi:hypothetical protein
MTSWLLPGYPLAMSEPLNPLPNADVHAPADVRPQSESTAAAILRGHATPREPCSWPANDQGQCQFLSPPPPAAQLPDLIKFTPHVAGGFASSPPSLILNHPSTDSAKPRKSRRKRSVNTTQNSVSVNELFEGLDSSISQSSLDPSTELTGIVRALTPHRMPLHSVTTLLEKSFNTPRVSSGANGTEESPGDLNRIASSTRVVSDWEDAHLAFAASGGRLPLSAIDGLAQLDMHSLGGRGKTDGSSGESSKVKGVHFDDGARGAGETGELGSVDGDGAAADDEIEVFACAAAGISDRSPLASPPPPASIMDSRWSFEDGRSPLTAAAAIPGKDVESVGMTKLLEGGARAVTKGRAKLAVRVRAAGCDTPCSKASGKGRKSARARAESAFRAAMDQGAALAGEDIASKAGCAACLKADGGVCADCAVKRAARGKGLRINAAQAAPPPPSRRPVRAKPRVQGRSGAAASRAQAEQQLHVQLHMGNLRALPASGSQRTAAVLEDTVDVARLIVFAVTGTLSPVRSMQKSIRLRQPVSRDVAWTVLSSDARDFIECLLMEQLTPERALEVGALPSLLFPLVALDTSEHSPESLWGVAR